MKSFVGTKSIIILLLEPLTYALLESSEKRKKK